MRHEIQDLIDAGKITDPETRKPNTQNNPLPNYRNAPPPDAPVLLIGPGLIEEQDFNSFVNANAELPRTEPESLPQNPQTPELPVHVLDIWSSDDEDVGPVDLWGKEGRTEDKQVRKVEENKTEADSLDAQPEEAESSDAKAKEEEVIASV